VYYGFLINSMPVVIWNVIAVVINFLMVGAFFYFVRKEKMAGLRQGVTGKES